VCLQELQRAADELVTTSAALKALQADHEAAMAATVRSNAKLRDTETKLSETEKQLEDANTELDELGAAYDELEQEAWELEQKVWGCFRCCVLVL
jgi:chromosome segregation ATPase